MVPLLRELGGRAYGSARRTLERPLKDISFALNRHYLANPLGARAFLAAPPSLDGIQQRMLGDLNARGLALAHFTELFGDGEAALFDDFARTLRAFADHPHVQEVARRYQETASRATWKDYVVKMFPTNPATIPWTHPVLQTALHHRLLDVVSTYLGMWARLLQVNAWYTVPVQDPRRERIASQRWHRDPEDRRLLKVFLFVHDVDETAGPLEYIPSTRTGGPRSHLLPPVGGITTSTQYN